MIPKNFIQDLLNRLDIVDVIERYVPLKKAGANYVACCPFHSEKSPSFTVSQAKQFYHCFGCGAHGTAIGFVMEHGGLGYVDAIEELAGSVGLAVPHERPASGEIGQNIAAELSEVMQSATRYYREQLKASDRAVSYLKQRGLNGEIAAKFGIGYAPDAWQNLADVFHNYQDDSLLETGLVISSDEGKRYDRFRDRIMFPIVSQRGQVIGFGGRVLGKGEPKYLNSPETTLFEKGRELYGLYQAQKTIRSLGQVLVVEGYMDVVALAQSDIAYAVATLGTATTSFHLQKLMRIAEHVVFCFDGDKAGQRAAWRALENALPLLSDNNRFSFLFLPVEHDPDSFVREFGKSAFEKRIRESMSLSAYLVQEIRLGLDLSNQDARNQLIQRAKPLLTSIKAPATALLLRKQVAELSGVSQAELESLYEIEPVARTTRRNYKKATRSAPSADRLLLQCLLAQPQLGKQVASESLGAGADAEAVSALLLVLRESDFALTGPAITQLFQGGAHEKTIAAAEADMMLWSEKFDVEAEFAGLINKFADAQRRQQFRLLQEKLTRGGGMHQLSEEDREMYRLLLQRS
ncbi:MAG: DNA primase [Gallionella sp.]